MQTPDLRGLRAPAPLLDLRRWLVWRYEPGPKKALKVPCYASGTRRHGRQGTPEDLTQLVTFAEACEAAQRLNMSGVGFVPGDGWMATDFDRCVDGGVVHPDVLAVIAGTCAEFSPSGTGVRAYFRGDLGNRKSFNPASFDVELFSSTGFVTVTGNLLPHVDLLGLEDTVAPVTPALAAFCEARLARVEERAISDDFTAGFEPKVGLSYEAMEALLDKLDPDMPREPWIKVGLGFHHECEGDDTGFDLWNDWSSMGASYPGEDRLRYEWDNFRGPQKGVKSTTLATALRMVKTGEHCVPVTPERLAAKAEEVAGTPTGGPSTGPDFGGRFPAYSLDQMAVSRSADWLIKGVLPRGDLVAIYGASGAGKSFVALDMAIAVSRGEPWRGLRTKKTRGLLVVAEGAGGYGKRIRAACQQRGIEPGDADLAVVMVAPNILLEDDIVQLMATVQAVGEVGFIVFDTFAQVTPGSNENSGEDMGKALANLRMLREVTKATNVLVHHAGKDLSRGLRGWSGIHAAVDAAVEVSREENGDRLIRTSKMKDGDDGLQWAFRLDTVVLGMDADGDDETSCIVVETELKTPTVDAKGVKRRSRMERHVLEVVGLQPSGATGMALADLVEQAAGMLPPVAPDQRDTRRQVVTRAIQTLVREREGVIGLEGGFVVFYCN